MIDIETLIVTAWDAVGTLPELWSDSIPMERWESQVFPVAVFGESRFGSERLNGGTRLVMCEFQFRVFHTDKMQAFTLGQAAVTFMEGFEAEGVYSVRVNSSATAVRTELGGLDVWYFEFRAEIKINE